MTLDFRNPSDDSDGDSDLMSDVNELEVAVVRENSDIEDDMSEHSLNAEDFETMDDTDDDSDEDFEDEEEASGSGVRAPRGSDSEEEEEANINNINEDEEDDDTIKSIIASIKKPRSVPKDIELDEFITDISFHPSEHILAAGLITGDIQLIKYHSNEENDIYKTMEVHTKACRDVEFSDCGKFIISGSKDMSIMITDIETEKLKKFYDGAHTDSVNKIYVLDDNCFFSGDDSGHLKMWDMRTDEAVFSLHEVEDQITAITSNESQKILVYTSSDGYLTSINIGARKMFVQSEPYPEELTCIGTFRGESKIAVGTSKGKIYTFNWGQFGYHSDMFPSLKIPISNMIPITDRISALAGEDGHVRACHIAPFRNLGIIGQHSLPVEAMDINCGGDLIATASHNNDIRFWNIKYFEDFKEIKFNEKHNKYKERMHNLPSSKYSNTQDFFSDLGKDNDG